MDRVTGSTVLYCIHACMFHVMCVPSLDGHLLVIEGRRGRSDGFFFSFGGGRSDEFV